MKSIWVVEHPKNAHFAQKLMGDFAVRSAASLGSLVQLLKMNRRDRPGIIVLNADGQDESLSLLVENCRSHLQRLQLDDTHLVMVGQEPEPGSVWSSKVTYLNPSIDAFQLSRLISYLFDECEIKRAGAKHMMSYKDVSFDPTDMSLHLLHAEPRTLTPKEGRLLKILLESPDRCISREIISQTIWPRTQVTPRTIDTHISRLRCRLQDSEVTIESVYGGGYVLK